MFFKSTISHTSVLIFLFCIFTGCVDENSLAKANLEITEDVISKKEDFILADEFLAKLKNGNSDTIIYCERTCIGCCDFYNIYWSRQGRYFVHKIYFDSNLMATRSTTSSLDTNDIFSFLSENYAELEKNKIEISFPSRDHYCFSSIDIYTKNDKLETGRITDESFNENPGFGLNPNDMKKVNRNYSKNIQSEWYILILLIENSIRRNQYSSDREMETLQTN